MGFDSRHLVLEFLAENRNLNIQQMTLIFLGKRSDAFLQECLNEELLDKVYVYHSKGTRLFWKEYGFDKLEGTILELLLGSNSSMNLKKEEITFKVTEPYYFLDLRDFDFEYLSIIPVIENEELAGFAMLYGYQLIEESKYPHVSLRRLFRNIIKNEISAKYTEFDNLLAGITGYIDFKQKLYLSKKLAEILNVDRKVENGSLIKEEYLKLGYRLLDSHIVNNLNLVELELDNRSLMALDELGKPKSIKEFTLFYILNTSGNIQEMFKEILKIVDLVFPKTKVSFYKVSECSITILINQRYLKKVINEFKRKLRDYLVIDIRNNSDVSPNANLKLVIDYLEETKVRDFNFEEYKAYRLTKEEIKYSDGRE